MGLRRLSAMLTTATCAPDKLHMGACSTSVVQSSAAGKPLGSHAVYVVVEGFLLFHDASLCKMFDAHVWLESDCNTCMRRRCKRNRRRNVDDFERFYLEEVWPNFLRHRSVQLSNASAALHLDATTSVNELVSQTAAHVQKLQLGSSDVTAQRPVRAGPEGVAYVTAPSQGAVSAAAARPVQAPPRTPPPPHLLRKRHLKTVPGETVASEGAASAIAARPVRAPANNPSPPHLGGLVAGEGNQRPNRPALRGLYARLKKHSRVQVVTIEEETPMLPSDEWNEMQTLWDAMESC